MYYKVNISIVEFSHSLATFKSHNVGKNNKILVLNVIIIVVP